MKVIKFNHKFNPKFDLELLKPAKIKGGKYIDYSQKTNSRKNALEIENGKTIYFANPLVNGNAKLDPNIMIFDILAVYACPNCSECRKTCYASRDQNQYPATFNKRLIMSYLAKNKPEHLKALIVKQLKKTKRTVCRIHTSGDFFSQEYVNMWIDIIKQFPNIRFYTYTKTSAFWDFSNKPENLNIVNSILPDGSINYGTIEYIKEKADKYGYNICPVTLGIEGAKCGKNCDICQKEEYVLFKIHN